MKRSHFTHLFCFVEKRLASKESQRDFEKSNKFQAKHENNLLWDKLNTVQGEYPVELFT